MRPSFIRERAGGALRAMACLGLAWLAAPAAAHAENDAPVTITGGYFAIRPHMVIRGFFTLHNNTGAPLLITGWKAPVCGQLVLQEAGASVYGRKPRTSDYLTVPAKRTMIFTRGGYHLACEMPQHELHDGDTIPVTATLRSGATIKTDFPVRAEDR
ncbi:copper chaperone PCu(A)C [Rhizosaccharibacter radicis]|uniref:Copper chaperone PCu(A)C n=1 Tax=Rhizosaccharibacter radicis TaxID=2782605 RepID=A0ABT1VWA4_9PROT|nr:copper chaperone PCu(A)C [Acetobacteraceae bacterium KSS12]